MQKNVCIKYTRPIVTKDILHFQHLSYIYIHSHKTFTFIANHLSHKLVAYPIRNVGLSLLEQH